MSTSTSQAREIEKSPRARRKLGKLANWNEAHKKQDPKPATNCTYCSTCIATSEARENSEVVFFIEPKHRYLTFHDGDLDDSAPAIAGIISNHLTSACARIFSELCKNYGSNYDNKSYCSRNNG